MKNKLILFLLMCLIAAPCIAKKTIKQKNNRSTVTTKNVTLNINARVLIARKTKGEKKKKSSSRLNKCEKDLTSYLDYNDYKLLTSGSKATKIKSSYKIKFSNGRSVTITPVNDDNGKIKANVAWNVPGNRRWSKTLNFKKGKRSIISGPKDKKGGMYLMSLEIK